MLAGSALDVIEVDAASNRGIEEIRALRESVKFAPSSMRMKVFIIDEAHMLTREGANAFLKTLEEPPPHAVFILATTAPEALPATILSRCQRYAFRRIPVAVMIARMREIADAEGIAIDDGALGAIAYRADGGLRDALTMLEQVASYAGGFVDAATVDAAFGATGRQYARALVDAILGGEAATALRVVDEASDAGADMLGLVRGAIAEYRNLLVARIDPELLSRDLSNADADAVSALAAGTPQPKVVRGLRLLADALAAGRASGNPRLELETAVLRLIVQTEDPSLEALATRVALLEGGAPVPPAPVVRSARAVPDVTPAIVAPTRTEPAAHVPPPRAKATPAPVEPTRATASSAAPAPAPAERPAIVEDASPAPVAPAVAAVSPPAPTLQQVRSLWDQIRLRVEEQSKPLKGPLSRATVDELAGNALTISVPDDFQESLLRDKLPLIESAIADSLRVPLRLVLRNRATRSGDAYRAAPTAVREAASPETQDGEVNLLAYARRKIGGTETS
jgi:DNA polymerase-3 subunit gamma/tau